LSDFEFEGDAEKIVNAVVKAKTYEAKAWTFVAKAWTYEAKVVSPEAKAMAIKI